MPGDDAIGEVGDRGDGEEGKRVDGLGGDNEVADYWGGEEAGGGQEVGDIVDIFAFFLFGGEGSGEERFGEFSGRIGRLDWI